MNFDIWVRVFHVGSCIYILVIIMIYLHSHMKWRFQNCIHLNIRDFGITWIACISFVVEIPSRYHRMGLDRLCCIAHRCRPHASIQARKWPKQGWNSNAYRYILVLFLMDRSRGCCCWLHCSIFLIFLWCFLVTLQIRLRYLLQDMRGLRECRV